MSRSHSDKTYDFVQEWINYAGKEKNDLFFPFFCYYLAFNHLYDSMDLWLGEDRIWLYARSGKTRRSMDELDKIISLLRGLLSGPSPRFSFSVSDEEWSVLKTVKWRDPRTGCWIEDNPASLRPDYRYPRPPSTAWLSEQIEKKTDPSWRSILAMVKVYRIRCNLFHGDKHVTDERDIRFVKTSNAVLERFLRTCAAEHLGIEYIHDSHPGRHEN